jgi:hypothetical protein
MGSHTFTRQELYDLVWSEPMTKLGARFGISGNGLKKACKRANIPVPPQGYWNKLHAGHKVTKTPLPPTAAGTPAKVTIDPPMARPAPPPPPPVPASVQEAIDAERQSGKPVTVPATLSNPHRIVDAWIQESRREIREARHDPYMGAWRKPIDGTPVEKRRLRILSALFKALEARGYKLVVGDSYRRQVQIALGYEKLEVHLDERVRQVRRQITAGDRAKGHYSVNQTWTQEKVPTGELILKIKTERYIANKEWRETEDAPLEGTLNEVIAQIAGMYESIRLRREHEAVEQKLRRRQAEERHRAEMERKRETVRFRRLISHCDNWRAACDIRALVAAVEGSALAAEKPEEFRAWKSRALGHAERIDPLQDDGLFDRQVDDCDVYRMRD